MKAPLTHPTWSHIHRDVTLLCNQIERDRLPVDTVVGLSRGGLVPGVATSHILQKPFVPVSYSSSKGKGDDKNHSNELPLISHPILSGMGMSPNPPVLLIVDDICDSGYTLSELVNHYQKQGHVVYTMTLYYKESAVYTPSHYLFTLNHDDPWITFPWEC